MRTSVEPTPLSAALSRLELRARGVGRRRRRDAPRIAPVAVRIPDPAHLEAPLALPPGRLQLLVHEGSRRRLERRLVARARRPVVLHVTDNRRSMVTGELRDGVFFARVHHMFLDAPERVIRALVELLVMRSDAASEIVGAYISAEGHRIRACRRVRRVRPRGLHHDLEKILQDVNDAYFAGALDVLVTWGRRTRRGRKGVPRKAIKLGSYSASERLIRIHPCLDRRWIPRYFVAHVIHHELLHHLIPSRRHGRQMLVHTPEFVARERQFRHFDRAEAWERAHLARLLRT